MNRTQVVAALILGLVLPASPMAAQGAARVAVAGFETDGSVGMSRDEYDAVGRALTALVSAELGSRGTATTAIVSKPVAGARSGRVDVGAARTAANAAGATVLVVGTLLDQYGDIHIEARLLNAKSAEPIAVVRSGPSYAKREQLAEAIADLADRIAQLPAVGGRAGPALVGAVPVAALVLFGNALRFESVGDSAKAAEAYRGALKLAPGLNAVTTTLKRAGG